jgi:hypothetical protein
MLVAKSGVLTEDLTVIKFQLVLPNDFDEYAWEVESKGWFNAIAEFDGNRYQISFYDPTRLSQDIEDELDENPIFYESNLLVVKSVDRSNMEKAVEYVANTGKYIGMIQKESV